MTTNVVVSPDGTIAMYVYLVYAIDIPTQLIADKLNNKNIYRMIKKSLEMEIWINEEHPEPKTITEFDAFLTGHQHLRIVLSMCKNVFIDAPTDRFIGITKTQMDSIYNPFCDKYGFERLKFPIDTDLIDLDHTLMRPVISPAISSTQPEGKFDCKILVMSHETSDKWKSKLSGTYI